MAAAHGGLIHLWFAGRMHGDVTRELQRREKAASLVRISSWIGVALGVLLTAVFTMAAAGSTHTRRAVTHVVRARRPVATPVVAPAPPLVSVASPAATQAPPPSPAPSAAPVAATPVVVSGGS